MIFYLNETGLDAINLFDATLPIANRFQICFKKKETVRIESDKFHVDFIHSWREKGGKNTNSESHKYSFIGHNVHT